MQDLLKIAELIDRARRNVDTHRQITTDQLTELLQFAKDVDQTLLFVEKDLDDLNIQIDERKREIAAAKQKIKETKKMNKALEAERNRLQLQVDKIQQQSVLIEKEQATLQKQQDNTEKQLGKRRLELDELSNRVQSLEAKINGARETNEKTISGKRHERDEAERSLKELKETNVVIDYILNEGVRDIPEVEFLASLIRKTSVSISELRSESKLSAKATNEFVETLQSKGVIEVQADGNIRFLKPL